MADIAKLVEELSKLTVLEAADLAKAKDEMRHLQPRREGHYVEAFRYATEFVQY